MMPSKETTMDRTFIFKLFVVACLFVVTSLFSLTLSGAVLAEETGTNEGRRMSREAQLALLEANRRYEADPEGLKAARQPLLDYIAAGQAESVPLAVPLVMYKMLGQFWYADNEAENRLAESQKVFAAGHKAYPDDESLLRNYAVITYEAGQLGKAARLFEKYYEMSKAHDIKYLTYAASAFYGAQNLKEAKRVFIRLINLVEKPESKWLESVIAICMEQKATKDALKYIERALNFYPMEKKYWNLMATIYLDKSNYNAAASALEIGTRVKPPDKENEWKHLIDLYNYLSLPLRSAKSIQKGLARSGDNSEAPIMIADAFARGMRVDEAIAYIDSVLSNKPNLQLLLTKGRILFEARRNQAAIAAFDECLSMNPNAWEAYVMKGWAAWDEKDWKTAKRAFTMALSSKKYKTQAKDALEMLDSLDEAKSK
jgi:tetratricopeptide (TPR) repeat protein